MEIVMNKFLSVMVFFGAMSANANLLKIDTVDVVSGAQNLGLDQPVSIRSDVNGVCVLLGYDSGIEGTKIAVTETQTRKARHTRWDFGGVMNAYTVEVATKADALVIDASGNVVKQVYSRQLSSLKCVKKI
jgi:hypothetical protein